MAHVAQAWRNRSRVGDPSDHVSSRDMDYAPGQGVVQTPRPPRAILYVT
jgi:hypothetical protein